MRRSCSRGGLTALVLLLTVSGCGSSDASPDRSESRRSDRAVPFDHTHATLGQVAERFFHPDGVRYEALKADRSALDAYVGQLGSVSPETFDSWTREQQMAYLINAYNALVVGTVIDHHPIQRRLAPSALVRPANSVWQIAGFFDGIQHDVAGRRMTLDDIEHAWLRPRYQDPRIHFAIVCAARSCPPLRTEAYTPDRLDAQLEEQARTFYTGDLNRFDRANSVVELSRIFDWFGEDFEPLAPQTGFRGEAGERGILALGARFLPDATAEWLRSGDYEIRYQDYDWELNELGSR